MTQHRENAECSASREKPESREKRQITYNGTSGRLPSEFLFATTRQIVFQNTKGNCQPRITYQTGSRAKVNKDYSRHAHMLIMNRTLWGKKTAERCTSLTSSERGGGVSIESNGKHRLVNIQTKLSRYSWGSRE